MIADGNRAKFASRDRACMPIRLIQLPRLGSITGAHGYGGDTSHNMDPRSVYFGACRRFHPEQRPGWLWSIAMIARTSRSNLSRLTNVHFRKRRARIGQAYIIGRIGVSLIYSSKLIARVGARGDRCRSAQPILRAGPMGVACRSL